MTLTFGRDQILKGLFEALKPIGAAKLKPDMFRIDGRDGLSVFISIDNKVFEDHVMFYPSIGFSNSAVKGYLRQKFGMQKTMKSADAVERYDIFLMLDFTILLGILGIPRSKVEYELLDASSCEFLLRQITNDFMEIRKRILGDIKHKGDLLRFICDNEKSLWYFTYLDLLKEALSVSQTSDGLFLNSFEE
jgi:hypothetical protein